MKHLFPFSNFLTAFDSFYCAMTTSPIFYVLSWTFTQCIFIFILHFSYWTVIIYYCLSNWNERIYKYRIILEKDNPMNVFLDIEIGGMKTSSYGWLSILNITSATITKSVLIFLVFLPNPLPYVYMVSWQPSWPYIHIYPSFVYSISDREIKKTAHQKIFTMLKANC